MSFLPDKDHPLFKDGYDAGMADGHRLMKPLQERIRELEAAVKDRENNISDTAAKALKWMDRAEKAEAELAALRAGNMVLVPKEPTGGMLTAARLWDSRVHTLFARGIYEAMLAAAPVADGKEPK